MPNLAFDDSPIIIMTNKKSKFNFKITCIIVIAILCIVVFLYLAINFKKIKIAPDIANNNIKTEKNINNKEAEKIKEDNREAIENAKKTLVKTVRKADVNDHIFGDINAKVHLIIYDDFQCPFCARFYDTTEKIKEHFGDKVAIIYRHFPLRFHKTAISAALASECAAEQGKFWEMYDKIFADNKNKNFNIKQFKKDAVDLGLDAVKFNQCLDTEKYKDKIQQQMIEGKNFGVSGTPGNFVNGEPIPGAYPFEDFTGSTGKKREGMKSIIERHLK